MQPTYIYPLLFIGITSAFQSASRPDHNGIDLGWNSGFGGSSGTVVYAAAAGTVSWVRDGIGNTPNDPTSYGNVVYIDHPDGNQTRYAHLQVGILVSQGNPINQFDPIGYMGNTGYSFGTHLHFEVRIGASYGVSNGTPVDPVSICYAMSNQTISASTWNNFNILTMGGQTPPVITPEQPSGMFNWGDWVEITNPVRTDGSNFDDFVGLWQIEWTYGDIATLHRKRLFKYEHAGEFNTANIIKVL